MASVERSGYNYRENGQERIAPGSVPPELHPIVSSTNPLNQHEPLPEYVLTGEFPDHPLANKIGIPAPVQPIPFEQKLKAAENGQ